MTSTSINDSIPSELLFRTFQFFDEYEFVKLREICKSWLEIIDENRLFWQVAKLAREEIIDWDEDGDEIVTGEAKDPEWNEKVLRLFDEKSCSTLKEVSLKLQMYGRIANSQFKNRAEGERFGEFVQLLSKSRSTLRILSLQMNLIPDHLLEYLLISLDYRTMPLVDLRLWEGQHSDAPCQVKILRRSPSEVAKQVPEEGIALQVLWTHSFPGLLFGTEFILPSLVSLSIDGCYQGLTLHSPLKALRKQLKHLNLFIVAEHWELEPLHFPNLEILELSSDALRPRFPQWISCPSSLKLGSYDFHQGLPSIAELFIQTLEDCTPLCSRCPLLHTFRFKSNDDRLESLNLSNLVKSLMERRAQVEAGMEVDGIKMQNIKTVILPFKDFEGESETSGSKVLDQIRSLVETVIDSGDDGEKWELVV